MKTKLWVSIPTKPGKENVKSRYLSLSGKTTLSIFFFVVLLSAKIQGQNTTIAQNLNAPFDIATDGTDVYWVEGDITTGAVKKVSVNGGSARCASSCAFAPRSAYFFMASLSSLRTSI